MEVLASIVFIVLISVFYKHKEISNYFDKMYDNNLNNNEPDIEQKTPNLWYPDTIYYSQDESIDTKSIKLQLKRYACNYQYYLDYLKTEQWTSKKLLRFAIDKGICQECGKQLLFKQSHCHHKSYRWLYEEPMEDLETLCRYCHIEIRHAGKQKES